LQKGNEEKEENFLMIYYENFSTIECIHDDSRNDTASTSILFIGNFLTRLAHAANPKNQKLIMHKTFSDEGLFCKDGTIGDSLRETGLLMICPWKQVSGSLIMVGWIAY
jgi:hypothetical protein